MKAQRLPSRKQKVKLIQDVGEVLTAGTLGWIIPNKEGQKAKDTANIPDYLFRPEVNPELSFLVFAHEVEPLLNSADSTR
jgi:hypothetical protein